MDELEKELYEKYGTGIIPSRDIREILRNAAEMNLIRREDVTEMEPMDASHLLKKILEKRRQFLFSDSFDLSYEEEDEMRLGSIELKKDDQIVDKVLKAYFEYEKITTVKRGVGFRWIVISSLILGSVLYLSYYPKPY